MVEKHNRELTFIFLFLELLPLEQDAVCSLEALLLLCSQDDSPGAQATLKVTLLLSFPSTAVTYSIVIARITERLMCTRSFLLEA